MHAEVILNTRAKFCQLQQLINISVSTHITAEKGQGFEFVSCGRGEDTRWSKSFAWFQEILCVLLQTFLSQLDLFSCQLLQLQQLTDISVSTHFTAERELSKASCHFGMPLTGLKVLHWLQHIRFPSNFPLARRPFVFLFPNEMGRDFDKNKSRRSLLSHATGHLSARNKATGFLSMLYYLALRAEPQWNGTRLFVFPFPMKWNETLI